MDPGRLRRCQTPRVTGGPPGSKTNNKKRAKKTQEDVPTKDVDCEHLLPAEPASSLQWPQEQNDRMRSPAPPDSQISLLRRKRREIRGKKEAVPPSLRELKPSSTGPEGVQAVDTPS